MKLSKKLARLAAIGLIGGGMVALSTTSCSSSDDGAQTEKNGCSGKNKCGGKNKCSAKK